MLIKKWYKLNNEYIRLDKIYQIKEIELHNMDKFPQILKGLINGREYQEIICLSHYRSECRQEFLEKNEFYKQYVEIYKAFLVLNKLEPTSKPENRS